ncbi:unnamed protein product [Mytilus coruscus]|uniref:MAM domain-containing protein n=1 Tax=Mytilus coruscus TaxID=42192 RepID=A0A6J8ERJ4_MYTCO|nr:unnamed protein product [Mytilus coruscus]
MYSKENLLLQRIQKTETELIKCRLIRDVISSCTYEYLEEPNCQFYNDRSGLDYADWIKYYNKTPSEDTGPESAIGGKYYMYIETSTMNSGQNARLISSLLSTDTQLCLSFYYHMFGDSIGELQVIINTPGSNQIIFRKSNSQGNYWHYKQLFLQPASQFQQDLRNADIALSSN